MQAFVTTLYHRTVTKLMVMMLLNVRKNVTRLQQKNLPRIAPREGDSSNVASGIFNFVKKVSRI